MTGGSGGHRGGGWAGSGRGAGCDGLLAVNPCHPRFPCLLLNLSFLLLLLRFFSPSSPSWATPTSGGGVGLKGSGERQGGREEGGEGGEEREGGGKGRWSSIVGIKGGDQCLETLTSGLRCGQTSPAQ